MEEQSIEGLRKERLVFGGITVVMRVSAEDSGAEPISVWATWSRA